MMHGQCCLNKIEPYIVGFSLFLDLTNLCFLFTPAQMSSEQIDLEDCAMGDGVHETVSMEQPMMLQDQSSQTTYHPKNGERRLLVLPILRRPLSSSSCN